MKKIFTITYFITISLFGFSQKNTNWLVQPSFDLGNDWSEMNFFHFNDSLDVSLIGKQRGNESWNSLWGVFNHKNYTMTIPPKYESIEILSNTLFVVKSNGKYGLVDDDEKLLLPITYDNIELINSNFYKVETADNIGVMNDLLQLVIPMEFDEIEVSDNIFKTRKNKKYSFYTLKGQKISSLEYDYADKFQGNSAIIQIGKGNYYDEATEGISGQDDSSEQKYIIEQGLIGINGDYIIPLGKHEIKRVKNFILEINTKNEDYQQFIKVYNQNGKLLSDSTFSSIEEISNDVLKVNIGYNKQGFLNTQGNIRFFDEIEVSDWEEKGTLIKYRKGDKYGYFDVSFFKVLIQPIYDEVSTRVEDGKAIVCNEDKCGCINSNLRWVVPLGDYRIEEFHNSLVIAIKNWKYGILNEFGEVLQPFIYSRIYATEEGYLKVYLNNNSGYVNKQGKLIIRPQEYDYVDYEENGLFTVKRNGKYGLINENGKIIASCKYDYINVTQQRSDADFQIEAKYLGENGFISPSGTFFKDNSHSFHRVVFYKGVASIKTERQGKIGFIRNNGTWLVYPKYDFTSGFTSSFKHYAVVQRNGKKGLIGIGGNELLPAQFDQIEMFVGSYAIARNSYGAVIINRHAEQALSQYFEDAKIIENLGIWVKQNGLWGLIQFP